METRDSQGRLIMDETKVKAKKPKRDSQGRLIMDETEIKAKRPERDSQGRLVMGETEITAKRPERDSQGRLIMDETQVKAKRPTEDEAKTLGQPGRTRELSEREKARLAAITAAGMPSPKNESDDVKKKARKAGGASMASGS